MNSNIRNKIKIKIKCKCKTHKKNSKSKILHKKIYTYNTKNKMKAKL
jgi:hypothetical protein